MNRLFIACSVHRFMLQHPGTFSAPRITVFLQMHWNLCYQCPSARFCLYKVSDSFIKTHRLPQVLWFRHQLMWTRWSSDSCCNRMKSHSPCSTRELRGKSRTGLMINVLVIKRLPLSSDRAEFSLFILLHHKTWTEGLKGLTVLLVLFQHLSDPFISSFCPSFHLSVRPTYP